MLDEPVQSEEPEIEESEKFEIESEEKVDRNKIDTHEDSLLKIAERIR